MDPRLWMSGSGEAPRSVPLSGERTVVGRSPEADVQLEDEAVSWNHLEIERRGEVLMATDLDSRNGTALNGEPLDRPRRLRDGDTLIVGGHRLEVSAGSATPVGATVPPGPAVALNEEERATAAALVAPYRSEGAFAGRPATRAEIAAELHVSERTAQRRLDALAAKLEIAGDAGRDRPRQIAARVIELGLDRCTRCRRAVGRLRNSRRLGESTGVALEASAWLGSGQRWPGRGRGVVGGCGGEAQDRCGTSIQPKGSHELSTHPHLTVRRSRGTRRPGRRFGGEHRRSSSRTSSTVTERNTAKPRLEKAACFAARANTSTS